MRTQMYSGQAVKSQGLHPALFSPAWVSIELKYVMGKAQSAIKNIGL